MRWIGARSIIVFVSILALFGDALYSLWVPRAVESVLESNLDTSVTLSGVIVADPDVREKSILLSVEASALNNAPLTHPVKILVVADTFTKVAYGNEVEVKGTLGLPTSFETDSGRTFNYPKYLEAQGMSYVLSFGKVSVVREGKGNPIVAGLLSVKHFLERGIERALPQPESALAEGLLLGDKQSLGDALTTAFRRAGVVHVIVLSGYNVSVVIGAVLFVSLYFLSKRWALLLAALSVVAFAVMTGASETTIRASVMALIALFAKALNRQADGIHILFLTAASMALFNPFLVLFDLSYQLSILSTLGLSLFSDGFERHLLFIPETAGLREIIATTLATQLTVLPLLISSVGQVSLVFLATNLLVLPAIPLAMLVSFIAALVASISSALALPFSALAYAILHYVIVVSHWFGSLPFAAVTISPEYLPLTLSLLALLYASGFCYFAYRMRFS